MKSQRNRLVLLALACVLACIYFKINFCRPFPSPSNGISPILRIDIYMSGKGEDAFVVKADHRVIELGIDEVRSLLNDRIRAADYMVILLTKSLLCSRARLIAKQLGELRTSFNGKCFYVDVGALDNNERAAFVAIKESAQSKNLQYLVGGESFSDLDTLGSYLDSHQITHLALSTEPQSELISFIHLKGYTVIKSIQSADIDIKHYPVETNATNPFAD